MKSYAKWALAILPEILNTTAELASTILRKRIITSTRQIIPRRVGAERWVIARRFRTWRMNNIFLRAVHAPGYYNKIPLNPNYRRGILVIQRHKASHDHHDISIIDGDKEIFRGAVSKTELDTLFPKDTKIRTMFKRQPTHSTNYSLNTTELTIPEGEYGAGQVKKVWQADIEIIKTKPGEIGFKVSDSPFKGEYRLLERPGSTWLCIRKVDIVSSRADIFGKNEYKLIAGNSESNQDIPKEARETITKLQEQGNQLVVEQKVDGGCEYLRLGVNTGDRIINRLWSWRQSKVDNSPIYHEDKYNAIRDARIPKELRGLTLKGELVYCEDMPRSRIAIVRILRGDNWIYRGKEERPNINAKISNISNVFRSREEQTKGNSIFVIWDIVDKDLTYGEKRILMEYIARKIPGLFVPRMWDIKDLDKAWKKIVRQEGGEGLVIKPTNKLSADPNYSTEKWIKIKSIDFTDAKIIDYMQHSKRPATEIGGLIVDINGVPVEVGTGFTNFERTWYRTHINEILKNDSYIKVKSHYTTNNGSLMAPVYCGPHLNKSDPNSIIQELGLVESADNLNISPYQLKSSSGWTRS